MERSFFRGGFNKGLAQGMAQGMAQGKAEGMAEGIKKAQRENAQKMKADGLPSALIAKYTGLSTEEVELL